MTSKKWLFLFIGVILAFGVGYLGWQHFWPKAGGPQGGAIPVRVYTATKQDAPIVYEFVGDIRPLNEAQITARATGLIVERYVKGGDYVTEGQPLFKIDGQDYQTKVAGANAELASAEVVYSRAKQDRIRYQQLLAQNAISQQSYDVALATEHQAAAQIESIRSSLSYAQINLEYTIVRAPMSGRLDIEIASAGTNAMSGQTVLAKISSMNPVLVQFSINETDYLKFSKSVAGFNLAATPAKLLLADGSEYSEVGKITEVNPGLDANTGTLAMKAQFANPKNLLIPSMYSRIQLVGETRKDVIVIPERAVFMQLTKSFVNVVSGEGKVEMRPITLGPKAGNQIVIVEAGLQAGDRVIVEGNIKTTYMPGAPVKPIEMTLEEIKKSAAATN